MRRTARGWTRRCGSCGGWRRSSRGRGWSRPCRRCARSARGGRRRRRPGRGAAAAALRQHAGAVAALQCAHDAAHTRVQTLTERLCATQQQLADRLREDRGRARRLASATSAVEAALQHRAAALSALVAGLGLPLDATAAPEAEGRAAGPPSPSEDMAAVGARLEGLLGAVDALAGHEAALRARLLEREAAAQRLHSDALALREEVAALRQKGPWPDAALQQRAVDSVLSASEVCASAPPHQCIPRFGGGLVHYPPPVPFPQRSRAHLWAVSSERGRRGLRKVFSGHCKAVQAFVTRYVCIVKNMKTASTPAGAHADTKNKCCSLHYFCF